MSKAWTRDIVIDSGTFGGTKACHVLADLLNQNVVSIYNKHKVLSFINDFIFQFQWIATIDQPGVRERSMTLMRDHLQSRIDEMDYNAKFKSYLRNVLLHHYRKSLESRQDNRAKRLVRKVGVASSKHAG